MCFCRLGGAAAKRFFKWLLRNNRGEPKKIVTDKLRSYSACCHEVFDR
jgi:putative transposase